MFFIGLTILSDFINASSLNCISMENQECKTIPRVINVNSNNHIFYPLVLKLVNAVAIVIILKVHWCRFENFPVCSYSHKKTTLKISHS